MITTINNPPSCCRRLCLLLLVCLTSCAPQWTAPQAGLTQSAGITPTIETDTFISFDGATLPLRRWLPAGKADAIIVALHGFNDYSLFIDHAAHYFARHGIAVYAYDQRGFGASAKRGRWPGKNAFTQDVQTFIRLLHGRFPHTPVFLLGHSMGAAVALYTLSSKRVNVNGVILAAPAISGWSTMPWWQRWGLKLAARVMPWNTFTGQSLHIVASDNRDMLIALGRDPLVIKNTRVDTIYGLVNLMDAAYRAADALHTPALVLYGKKDEVIPEAPVLEAFGPAARSNSGLRFQIYNNGYHMLLRDLQAEVVWRDIITWIGNHNALLPSQQQKLSSPGNKLTSARSSLAGLQ